MTSRQALAFIRKHGVVLEAARGPAPSLVEAIAGAPVRGSWWSHPKSQEIFVVTRAVRDHSDILVCRLIEGKITFVHRRMWPALVRASAHIAAERLARLQDVHTEQGRHEIAEIAFPDWVPSDVKAAARKLAEESALAELAAWLD